MKTGRYSNLIETVAREQSDVLVEAAQDTEFDIFEVLRHEAIEDEIVASFGGPEKMVSALAAEKLAAPSFSVADFMDHLDAHCARGTRAKD